LAETLEPDFAVTEVPVEDDEGLEVIVGPPGFVDTGPELELETVTIGPSGFTVEPGVGVWVTPPVYFPSAQHYFPTTNMYLL